MDCSTLRDLPPPPPGKIGWPWTEETPQLQDAIPGGRLWPKVSIITPSYNQGEFIEETIRSVLLQGYPNLEYIAIDGGSTDNSVEIIKKYEPWLSYWVSEPDRGQSCAINKGWKKATGEVLAYLNSDDTYLQKTIITAASFFVRYSDISMIYGNCNIINEESKVIHSSPVEEFDVKRMLFTNIVPQPTAFFRKQVMKEIGYLDESLHMAMDLDMWIKIGLKFKVRYVPSLLGNLRTHASSKSSAQSDKFLPETLLIINKVFANPTLPEDVKVLRRKAYSHIYMKMGIRSYRAGELKDAKYHLLKSILIYPSRVFEILRVMVSTTLAKSSMGRDLIFLWKRLKNL